MGYKYDYKKIREHVNVLKEKYNFNGLYHFTDFTNLEVIFKSGYLYSRNDCDRNEIGFLDGADHRVLARDINNVYDKVRFYYRPKTPTLYKNEGIKLKQHCCSVHIPIPVYLLFDEELIYEYTTEFSNGNATTSDIGKSAIFFKSMDWSSIFHSTRVDQQERDYIINKRHAELLSDSPVLIDKYLKKIIFRCESDRKRAINTYGHNDLYCVDLSIFSDKNNYDPDDDNVKNNFIRDYTIDYHHDDYGNKTALIFKCEFQKVISDYTARFDIQGYDEDKFLNGKNGLEYKVEKYYIDQLGKVKKERDNCKKVAIKISGAIEEYKTFSIYVNDYLCIKEELKKCEIEAYDIKIKRINSNDRLLLTLQFKDPEILKFKHRYELVDCNNKLLQSRTIGFGNHNNGLEWNVTFDDYSDDWYKLKYYIDDVMYICDLVHSRNINYVTD